MGKGVEMGHTLDPGSARLASGKGTRAQFCPTSPNLSFTGLGLVV